jgi:hypothetical protein
MAVIRIDPRDLNVLRASEPVPRIVECDHPSCPVCLLMTHSEHPYRSTGDGTMTGPRNAFRRALSRLASTVTKGAILDSNGIYENRTVQISGFSGVFRLLSRDLPGD